MSLNLLDTFKAVFWSFFGVRKRSDYEADTQKLNPVHVIIVGIVSVVAFVLVLFAFVKFIAP